MLRQGLRGIEVGGNKNFRVRLGELEKVVKREVGTPIFDDLQVFKRHNFPPFPKHVGIGR